MSNYKKYLYFFLSIIFFLQIYYLYLASAGFPNSYISSELLISYSSGFIRRGLIGEVFISLFNFFDFQSYLFFFIFNFIVYCILFFLIFLFIHKSKNVDIIYLILFISPIFISYSLYEREALTRKEIYLFISFLAFIIYLRNSQSFTFSYVLLFFLTTFVVLIHELNIIFLPFFLIVFYYKFKNLFNFKKYLYIFLLILFQLLIILYFIYYPLTSEHIINLCNNTQIYFSDFKCKGAFFWLSQDLNFSINEVVKRTDKINIFRYIIINIITYLPFLYYFILINKKNLIFLSLGIISLPLYFVGLDWGRWVNINFTMMVLLFLYLRNNNYFFLEIVDFNVTRNKIFFASIYVFSWNIKILNTDDVGSIPLIRIFLKIIKKTFLLLF